MPIGPAEAVAFGFAAHRIDVRDSQVERGPALIVGAELAEKDRAVIGGGPRGNLVEISAKRGAIFGASPYVAMLVHHVVPGPGRALMGELERLVIVKGDEEIAVRRQLQQWKIGEAVPMGRAGDDDPRWIRPADGCQ